MARPTKYTPATVKKITEAIGKGATYELAAAYAGVSYDVFNRWMQDKSKSEFRDAVKLAEGKAALGWLAKIDAAAADGNWQAAAWKLERRHPRHYGRVSQAAIAAQVDVSSVNGGQGGENGSGTTATSATGPSIRVQFFTFDTVAATLTDGSAEDR